MLLKKKPLTLFVRFLLAALSLPFRLPFRALYRFHANIESDLPVPAVCGGPTRSGTGKKCGSKRVARGECL
jgi:hypothetical protein